MSKGRTKGTYLKRPVIQVCEIESQKPLMPAHLGPIAKKEFKRLVTLLSGSVELREEDGNALGKYCQAYEHWVTAEKNIAAEGYTVAGPNGMKRQNPNMNISNEAVKTMERIGKDFGLTPAARRKMSKGEPEKPSTAANTFMTWQKGAGG